MELYSILVGTKMQIQRTLSETIKETNKTFRVILLTGPRQVGKTTLLQSLEPKKRHYVTLDDLNLRTLAQQDPMGFLDRLQLPVLIDEIQYAPELFSAIKILVDREQKPGLVWLTGSQQFEMMKNVNESLAGRVAILKLQGISLAEEQNRRNDPAFLPTIDLLSARQKSAKTLSLKDVYHKIWRGSYPEVVTHQGKNWERYYESYVTTYIQRDIRDYLQINNQANFLKFMQIAASCTGQLLNYKNMATELGVDQKTVKSWINALQASGVITLLQPYFNNLNKRLIKTPKLYFMDTGLCAFLCGWLNEDVLERGAMSGAMLETYVVSEIMKSYLHQGKIPPLYFYRDKDKREIDLLIQQNDTIYPIEIKKTATINASHVKAFEQLKINNMNTGHGAVICLTQTLLPINREIDAVPVWYI